MSSHMGWSNERVFFKNKNDGVRILPAETGHCYEVVARENSVGHMHMKLGLLPRMF